MAFGSEVNRRYCVAVAEENRTAGRRNRGEQSQSVTSGVEPGRDAGDRIAVKGSVEIFRDVSNVRRGDDVVPRPERLVLWQRFAIVTIPALRSRSALATSSAPDALAISGVMFWLQCRRHGRFARL